MNKIELLAPAGSFEALKAAIAAGADAVYLGGSGYGARAYAKNFYDEELVEAIKLAHIYNVKVYVTINTLIYDNEFADVINYVNFLYNNDVDAIIVQDLGLMNVISKHFPQLELHASTQMTIHNIEGIKFLKENGINRVVLARENSIEDIKKINDEVDIETEVFIHGALCVCYSGQCLMSSLIGGRSGNRGKCAQPCRKRYNLYSNHEKVEKNKFMISPKDLNTILEIDKLIEANVKSLKIEGRMKSPQYVAIVVSKYRKAIDNYYKYKSLNITKEDLQELTQIFNRQFTKGFLFNQIGYDFINLNKNNNAGLLCGTVLSSSNNKVKIKLIRDLNTNDGIYFDNTDIGLNVSKIYKDNKEVKLARKEDIITLDVKENISKNVKVYKTTDVILNQKANEIINLDQKIPLRCEIELYIDTNPKLTVFDEIGNIITKEIDFIVEKSQKQEINVQRIYDQINKLGNTPFYLSNLKIKKDEGIFITLGALNNLRRVVIDELILKRQLKHNRKPINYIYQYNEPYYNQSNNEVEINVYCQTKEQLDAALKCNINKIYVNESIIDNNVDFSKIYCAKNRIDYNPKIEGNFKGFLISDLGNFNLKSNYDVTTNYNLNVTNSETIDFLRSKYVSNITLSYEMNESTYKNTSNKQFLEIIVYGYQEVMISKHCIFRNNCKKQCMLKNYYLEDEKGEKFIVYMDNKCHMHILNSKKLILGTELYKLKDYGFNKFRIQFSVEDYNETIMIIEAYKKLILNNEDTEINKIIEINKGNRQFTRGYFNKNIL